MAIRYRKEYKTWQVYWTNPLTGKRESKTFQSEAEAKKENSLVLHRLKYEPESFRREAPETKQGEPTLDQVYLEYLKEKQFSKKDLASHLQAMRPGLAQLGAKRINDITTEDLEKVKSTLLAKTDISPATVRARLSVLRTVMYYASKKKYCSQVQFPTIPNPRYKQFVPPTPEEIAAIYDAAQPHIKRVVIIGAYVGARVGACELLKLTWDDVDFSHSIIRVHGSKKNHVSEWREVPIRESLIPIFQQWHQEDMKIGAHYLVHYRGSDKPLESIRTSWKSALRKAGITRNIRPYDLRHAFGTELVAAGVDVGTVAKLMGHSNPTMLLTHYQYVMDKQKRAAVEALPEMPPMCRANVPQESRGHETPRNPLI